MDQLPVLPRIDSRWTSDGELDVVFPNRETRFDRWTGASTVAGAVMMAAALGLAGPAVAVPGAMCGWLVALGLRVWREPDRRRVVAVAAWDVALVGATWSASPTLVPWIPLLIGAAEVGLGVSGLMASPDDESRIRVGAERVAWGHGGGATRADIVLDHVLPVEALAPELVRTEDGPALQLAPGVLLPVANGIAGDLVWLRDRLAAAADARRARAGPADPVALDQLARLAPVSPKARLPRLARWAAPLVGVPLVTTAVAPGAIAAGAGLFAYPIALACVILAAAVRAAVTRDPWSERTAIAPLLLPDGTRGTE